MSLKSVYVLLIASCLSLLGAVRCTDVIASRMERVVSCPTESIHVADTKLKLPYLLAQARL